MSSENLLYVIMMGRKMVKHEEEVRSTVVQRAAISVFYTKSMRGAIVNVRSSCGSMSFSR